MNKLKTIHEHTLNENILPENANILDLGCRDFRFTNTFRDMNYNVYPVDIDVFEGEDYWRIGISDSDGKCSVNYTNDPQGTSIREGDDILMMTIETFSRHVGVDRWDLIKMDVEGSEMGILKSANHPISSQISVEFHAHSTSQTKEQIDECLDYLSQWYNIHNRKWEPNHGSGYNYWDVLLINKSIYSSKKE